MGGCSRAGGPTLGGALGGARGMVGACALRGPGLGEAWVGWSD
jgi:hypothetical protein